MITVKHGGDLKVGDFVAIADGYRIALGWFVGEGRNGSLQYFDYFDPKASLERYNYTKADPVYQNYDKANKENFNMSWIHKCYITSIGFRVIKIQNPESIITDAVELNVYLESKQILKQINFLK